MLFQFLISKKISNVKIQMSNQIQSSNDLKISIYHLNFVILNFIGNWKLGI